MTREEKLVDRLSPIFFYPGKKLVFRTMTLDILNIILNSSRKIKFKFKLTKPKN